MALAPCSICQQRYVGSAITGYHSWFIDHERYSYKQKICPRCAKGRFETYVRWGLDQTDENAQYPDHCPACGVEMNDDLECTYSTWFRGKQRRDRVLATCLNCAMKIRSVMEEGAERQPDRTPLGVGERGAPRSNPEDPDNRKDLPW